MPSSEPIIEQITQDIETWLNTVKIANGYQTELTVERRKRGGNAPKAGQTLAVLNQGQPQRLREDSQDTMGWTQPYYIDIYVDPDESRTTAVDTDINRARSDVEKALTYDLTSRTRGGLAFNTTIVPALLFTEGKHDGVQVRILVQYYTAFNDPYTASGGS